MLGIPLIGLQFRRSQRVFDPLVNYANGEQGAYYAPWDIRTLWQDDTRTVPVENYGDPVRVMDDLSPNGNHAVAPTSTARGTYGRMPAGVGRRNLLLDTEVFAQGWVAQNATKHLVVGPDGTMTAVEVTQTTSSGQKRLRGTFSLDQVTTILARAWLKAGTVSNCTVRIWGTGAVFSAAVDLEAGTTTAGTLTDKGDGWFELYTGEVALDGLNARTFDFYPGGHGTEAGDGTSSIIVWHPDLRIASLDGPYQRVGNQYDVSQAGVPDVYYIETDGIDDCYQTAPIDLTMYDSTSLAVGVQRPTAGPPAGMVLELSGDSESNNGSYAVWLTNQAGWPWRARHRGTTARSLTGTEPSNSEANVLSMSASISDPDLTVILQGELLNTTASQGTGNLGDYSLNLLSRNTNSLFFQGRFFGAIIVHPRSPYEEQSRQFLAKKAGVTL